MILITSDVISVGDYIINTKFSDEMLICLDIFNDGLIWSSIDGRVSGYDDTSLFKKVIYMGYIPNSQIKTFGSLVDGVDMEGKLRC
jgi:hypothetical protein